MRQQSLEVLSHNDIQQRVHELGEKITADYANSDLVLIGVLNGAFIFTADLCRAIDLDLAIDFIRVASYGDGTESSGEIRLSKTPELDLVGKDILLVEDIVDTGTTLAWLVKHFKTQDARSVKVCALVDKTERRTTEIPIDYAGFRINKGFLIGYGLDHAEIYRNLQGIYTLA